MWWKINELPSLLGRFGRQEIDRARMGIITMHVAYVILFPVCQFLFLCNLDFSCFAVTAWLWFRLFITCMNNFSKAGWFNLQVRSSLLGWSDRVGSAASCYSNVAVLHSNACYVCLHSFIAYVLLLRVMQTIFLCVCHDPCMVRSHAYHCAVSGFSRLHQDVIARCYFRRGVAPFTCL